MKVYDFVVVGSGCSGAIAAQTLQDSGGSIAMVDVGFKNPPGIPVPKLPYPELRKRDPQQFKYLVGDKGESLRLGSAAKGAQITPARSYVLTGADTFTPLRSDTFHPVESFAYGGLGAAWGLGCWQFSDNEILAAGLNPQKMQEGYQAVSDTIGISAEDDDARAYTIRSLRGYQPAAKLDRNHRKVYEHYIKNRSFFVKNNFSVGRAPLALLTKNKEDRKAYAYQDTDFYADHNKSAWRPWMMVDELKKKHNFTYIGNKLVLRFIEKRSHAELTCMDTATEQPVIVAGKKIILAAGALNTTRIVLRSFDDYQTRLPFLSNPYSYITTIQPGLLGSGTEHDKLGFAQLSLFLDENGNNMDVDMASMYSYQSLMLYRVMASTPLNYKYGSELLKFMLPGTIIMGLHHPDRPEKDKYIQLQKDKKIVTGDVLTATHTASAVREQDYKRRAGRYKKAARKLGLLPLKHVSLPYGSSIHYAGTLPINSSSYPYSLDSNGKLNMTERVYVADSSGFNYLPAKGLTFSLMANSYNVARYIAHAT